jgi:FlaA1/EpsC-like NDP-sugar epimerase
MRTRSLIGAIHPRLAVVVHDLAMVWIAWISTNWLRYSLEVNPPAFAWFTPEIGIVLLAQGLVLWWTGLYKGLWRFASLPDLWNIMRASMIGSILIAIALFLYNRLGTVPRAVLVIYPAALVVLLGAPRMAYRYWKDSRFDLATRIPAKRVLVLGAGRAGETLLRELARENRYRPVGVLDDNPALRGAKVHGVPVLGALVVYGLQRLQASLDRFDSLIDPSAPLLGGLAATISDIGDAARAVRQLAEQIDRNPNVLLTGKKAP